MTKTKAFKRVFVHWTGQNFDWPGKDAEELYRYSGATKKDLCQSLCFKLIGIRSFFDCGAAPLLPPDTGRTAPD